MKGAFVIEGIVQYGRRRGKSLGFPTANVSLKEEIPEGIYAATVLLRGLEYIAAVFIGTAKTYNESLYQAECHILGFKEDKKKKKITLKLYKKLRDNKKFSSVSALILQIKKDVEDVSKYFLEQKLKNS